MANSFRDYSELGQIKKSGATGVAGSSRAPSGERVSSCTPAQSRSGSSRSSSAPSGHAGSAGKASGASSSFEYNIPTIDGVSDTRHVSHAAASGHAASGNGGGTYGHSYQSASRVQSNGYAGQTHRRDDGFEETGYRKQPVSHNASSKKQKKKKEHTILFGLLFLLALLAVTVVVVVRSISNPAPVVVELDPVVDSFKTGVTVNGVDVSGMSIDEARAAVKPSIDNIVNSIAVVVKGDTFTATITAGQLNVQSDLETVLTSAFAGEADQSYTTKFTFDREALSLAIQSMNASLSYGPTDATFTLDVNSKGKPELNYIEGKAGMGFDVEATTDLIMAELEAGRFTAEVSPALTSIQPTVTVEDLKKQVSKISSYTTTYCAELPSDQSEEDRMIIENRAFNIVKASGIINGKIIQPGASFSFNKTVGNRNEKNGWKEAKGIYGGETYNMQYGGGVCQVSTTMYVAIMRAGIPYSAVTRESHSIPSTYVPKGLDATVDSGHIDFKFKNTTDSPLYIFAYSTVNKKRSRYRDLTVVIYGKPLEEGLSYDLRSVSIEELEPGEPIITYNKKENTDYNVVTVEARTGYVVDVYLDTYMNGDVINSEKLYEDRYEPITEKRTIGTIPTPTPVLEVPITE